jgi:hypothetical protein
VAFCCENHSVPSCFVNCELYVDHISDTFLSHVPGRRFHEQNLHLNFSFISRKSSAKRPVSLYRRKESLPVTLMYRIECFMASHGAVKLLFEKVLPLLKLSLMPVMPHEAPGST